MHPPYVVIHKPRGVTPLEAIKVWQKEHPRCASLPASYAGRLDPMAEGKLLVLLGDECKKQKRYTKFDKEYVIEVVLDLGTDTGDVLGLPAYALKKETHPERASVRKALKNIAGAHQVPYPAFSSKTVAGKPLFLYALEGTLASIVIPTHTEEVYLAKLLSVKELSKEALTTRSAEGLAQVPRSDEPSKVLGADFRQDAIRRAWKDVFERMPPRTFTLLTLRIASASGTYMRTLAKRIGNELGTSACALSINRTKIGRYTKLGPVGMWTKTF